LENHLAFPKKVKNRAIVNGVGVIFVPHGRIHGRTHGCKWSLLKVREGKYKGSMVVGPRWKPEAER
jgi:hypothetical protein